MLCWFMTPNLLRCTDVHCPNLDHPPPTISRPKMMLFHVQRAFALVCPRQWFFRPWTMRERTSRAAEMENLAGWHEYERAPIRARQIFSRRSIVPILLDVASPDQPPIRWPKSVQHCITSGDACAFEALSDMTDQRLRFARGCEIECAAKPPEIPHLRELRPRHRSIASATLFFVGSASTSRRASSSLPISIPSLVDLTAKAKPALLKRECA